MHYIGLNSDLQLVTHSNKQFEVERALEAIFLNDGIRLIKSDLKSEVFTVDLYDPVTDYYYSNYCWLKSIPKETPLLVFDTRGTYILAANEENLIKKLSMGVPYIINTEYNKDTGVVVIKTKLTKIVRNVLDLRIDRNSN